MKEYKSPNRDYGRYADFVNDNYDTNRQLWRRHMSPFWTEHTILDITQGSDAYLKHQNRYFVMRWVPWDGDEPWKDFVYYHREIEKQNAKKKSKENKRVYNRK